MVKSSSIQPSTTNTTNGIIPQLQESYWEGHKVSNWQKFTSSCRNSWEKFVDTCCTKKALVALGIAASLAAVVTASVLFPLPTLIAVGIGACVLMFSTGDENTKANALIMGIGLAFAMLVSNGSMVPKH